MMTKKLNTLLFGSFVTGISVYRLLWPGYYINLLVSPGMVYFAFRLSAAIFLLSYVFIPTLRTPFTRKVLSFISVLMLSFGVITWCSPTFLGAFENFIPIGDSLIFLEGGVLAMLLSIELPVNQWSPLRSRSFIYVASLLAVQPRKLLRAYSAVKSVPKTRKQQRVLSLRYALPFRI